MGNKTRILACPSSATKSCICCGVEKPLKDYYAHPMMGDGHLGKCKECVKAYQRERQAHLRANDPEWAEAEAERSRKKALRQYHKKLKGTTEYRAKCRKWGARARLKNPHKKAANAQVAWAIKSGTLTRPETCSECGSKGRIHGHHEDYSKPLDVEWLCSKCHGKRHRKER